MQSSRRVQLRPGPSWLLCRTFFKDILNLHSVNMTRMDKKDILNLHSVNMTRMDKFLHYSSFADHLEVIARCPRIEAELWCDPEPCEDDFCAAIDCGITEPGINLLAQLGCHMRFHSGWQSSIFPTAICLICPVLIVASDE